MCWIEKLSEKKLNWKVNFVLDCYLVGLNNGIPIVLSKHINMCPYICLKIFFFDLLTFFLHIILKLYVCMKSNNHNNNSSLDTSKKKEKWTRREKIYGLTIGIIWANILGAMQCNDDDDGINRQTMMDRSCQKQNNNNFIVTIYGWTNGPLSFLVTYQSNKQTNKK